MTKENRKWEHDRGTILEYVYLDFALTEHLSQVEQEVKRRSSTYILVGLVHLI